MFKYCLTCILCLHILYVGHRTVKPPAAFITMIIIIIINYVFIYCTCIYLCVNNSYVGGVHTCSSVDSQFSHACWCSMSTLVELNCYFLYIHCTTQLLWPNQSLKEFPWLFPESGLFTARPTPVAIPWTIQLLAMYVQRYSHCVLKNTFNS